MELRVQYWSIVQYFRWSDVRFFWARKLEAQQRLITQLSYRWANTVKTHKVYI